MPYRKRLKNSPGTGNNRGNKTDFSGTEGRKMYATNGELIEAMAVRSPNGVTRITGMERIEVRDITVSECICILQKICITGKIKVWS